MSVVKLKKGIKITHLLFYINFFLIFCLALTRATKISNVPVSIFLVITIIITALCSKQELIAYMCCLLPMQGIMQNRIALLIVAFGVLLRVKRISKSGVFPILLMIFWELLHANQTKLELYGFLQEFSPIIAVTVLFLDKDLVAKDGFIARTFAHTTLMCSIINLIACKKQFGYSVFSLGRFGNLTAEYEDFRGLMNPNTNSYICVVAICALLLLRYYNEENVSDKIIHIALFLFTILSQSKAAILCVFLAYIIFAYYSGTLKKISEKSIVKGSLVIVAILVGFVAFSDLLDVIISRFTSGDISTGRTVIDLFYFRHITSSINNFFYGIGLYKYTDQINEIYGGIWKLYPEVATMANGTVVYKPCHLGILEIVVVWGLPGLIFIYILLGQIMKKRKSDTKKMGLIPLFVILIYTLQSGFLGAPSILQSLILIICCVEYGEQKSIEQRTLFSII